jgi:hypothetical protein
MRVHARAIMSRPSEHKELHMFLAQVGSFDCVDDESVFDPVVMNPVVPPSEHVVTP